MDVEGMAAQTCEAGWNPSPQHPVLDCVVASRIKISSVLWAREI